MTPNQDRPVSAGSMLFTKIVTHAVVPTIGTVLALISFLFLLREPATGIPSTGAVFWVGVGGIVVLGVALQVFWVRRLDHTIREPVEELVDALDTGRVPGVGSGRDRADWEIRLLFRRVRTLQQRQQGERDEMVVYRELDHGIEAIVAYLDRIGTEEPPGDVVSGVTLLQPVEAALRALMERFDRREAELQALFSRLGSAVSLLGDDVAGSAAASESEFMALLEAVAQIRETRQSVDAIQREIDRGEIAATVLRGMLTRLTQQLDLVLEGVGSVSTRIEANASSDRRLAQRGTDLQVEVDGVRQRVERLARQVPTSVGF
jgi:hypothetical protein